MDYYAQHGREISKGTLMILADLTIVAIVSFILFFVFITVRFFHRKIIQKKLLNFIASDRMLKHCFNKLLLQRSNALFQDFVRKARISGAFLFDAIDQKRGYSADQIANELTPSKARKLLGLKDGHSSEELQLAYKSAVDMYSDENVYYFSDEIKVIAQLKLREIENAYAMLNEKVS